MHEHLLAMRDGHKLRLASSDNNKDIWLIATHGLGEHGDRHGHLHKVFASSFNTVTYDLRGHGRSEGKSAYIDNFFTYIEDLQEILIHLREKHKMVKFVLFGHSMGGVIVCGYIKSLAHKDMYPSKIFLSAPPIDLIGIGGTVLKYVPSPLLFTFAGIPLSIPLVSTIDLRYLSHDPKVKESYIKDPFTHVAIHSKLLLNLLKSIREIFSEKVELQCPTFVAIGDGDRIVNPQAVCNYFTEVDNCTLKIFHGAYHEMHNEIDKFKKPYIEFLKTSLTK